MFSNSVSIVHVLLAVTFIYRRYRRSLAQFTALHFVGHKTTFCVFVNYDFYGKVFQIMNVTY